jgi:hypothetical protein
MGRQDRRVTFSQIKSEGLGCSGTADWVAVSMFFKAEQGLQVLPWLTCA